jgi:putative MFS transporter
MSASLTATQVAARLDRLPISRFHYRFLALISLGVWFDAYDNFIAGALASLLPRAGVLPAHATGWFSPLGLFMAALPLGMFLGALVLGTVSDRLGRRVGFVFMLLLYSLATLVGGLGYYPLAAVAGSTAGLVLLVTTRFLAGAGIGAENVVMDTYVSEMMPRHGRGWAIALTHAAVFTAIPFAALLARLLALVGRPEDWWLLLLFGSVGALFAWYFRRNLPESPRWCATVGRWTEASETLQKIEREVERDTSQPLPEPVEVVTAPAPRRLVFREIWAPRYRGRTLMLTGFHLLQTVGYYGFMHWLVTLLEHKGFAHDDALSLQLGAFLLAPVGPLLGAWFGERGQRKWLLVCLAAGLAGLHLAFGLADSAWLLLALGTLVVVGSNWFAATLHAYQAELFPTEARATGVGFTYAWSRVSAAGINLVMPGLIATDLMAAFGVTATAFLGAGLIVALFGPLTNNRALEEVSPA